MSENVPDQTGGSPQGQQWSFQTGDSLGSLFELLANRRRRYVIGCLQEFDEPVALADLANEVTAREQDVPLSDVLADAVRRTYTSLYHMHVPKLADAGFVEYDREIETVALSASPEQLERLERLTGED